MSLREEICLGDLRLDACDPARFRFSIAHNGYNYGVCRIVSLGNEALVIEGTHPSVAKTDDLIKLCGDVEFEIKEYNDGLLVSDHVRIKGYGSHLYDRKSKAGVQLRYIDIRVREVSELAVTL